MFNVLKRKDTDPVEDFNGLWLNEVTGSLFVWNDKTDRPIKVGFAKDGKMVAVGEFDMEFKFTPRRNEQVYEYQWAYSNVPLIVLASVDTDNYDGSAIDILFGSQYGKIYPQDDRFIIVNQTGNVSIGDDLVVKCVPTAGSVRLKLYIISYE